jgi:hypothetical protein
MLYARYQPHRVWLLTGIARCFRNYDATRFFDHELTAKVETFPQCGDSTEDCRDLLPVPGLPTFIATDQADGAGEATKGDLRVAPLESNQNRDALEDTGSAGVDVEGLQVSNSLLENWCVIGYRDQLFGNVLSP